MVFMTLRIRSEVNPTKPMKCNNTAAAFFFEFPDVI